MQQIDGYFSTMSHIDTYFSKSNSANIITINLRVCRIALCRHMHIIFAAQKHIKYYILFQMRNSVSRLKWNRYRKMISIARLRSMATVKKSIDNDDLVFTTFVHTVFVENTFLRSQNILFSVDAVCVCND